MIGTHRAEDLLAHDAHVVGHAGEHGGRVEAPRRAGRRPRRGPPQRSVAPCATASSTSSRTMSNCSRDTIGPISVSQSIGSPTRSACGARHHALDEALGHLAHHVHALDARAGLAGVGEAAPQAPGDRVGQVRVGADDHRVLAAQLEHRALHALGARHAHAAADLHRAGEEDLGRRRLHQRLADARRRRARFGRGPPGRPARSNTSWIRWPISGVSDAGFSTTPLPAISAIATSPNGIDHG